MERKRLPRISIRKLPKEANYFGIASGKKWIKFSAKRLTPVKSNLVDAPYLKEFPLVKSLFLLLKITK